MKNRLVGLLLAAVVVLVPFGLSSSTNAQEAEGHAGRESSSTTKQQSPEGQESSKVLRDTQTLDALAFAGRLVKEKGRILLKDTVTKMSYQLDDQSRAKPYIGKQVKVVGKLDLNSNMIHIDRIEPMS